MPKQGGRCHQQQQCTSSRTCSWGEQARTWWHTQSVHQGKQASRVPHTMPVCVLQWTSPQGCHPTHSCHLQRLHLGLTLSKPLQRITASNQHRDLQCHSHACHAYSCCAGASYTLPVPSPPNFPGCQMWSLALSTTSVCFSECSAALWACSTKFHLIPGYGDCSARRNQCPSWSEEVDHTTQKTYREGVATSWCRPNCHQWCVPRHGFVVTDSN